MRSTVGSLLSPASDEDPWLLDDGEEGEWLPGDDGDEWPPHFGAARIGIP